MNSHALAVLEFPRVLDVVAGHATSDLGAARIRALIPLSDRQWLESEHARVAAMRAAIVGDEPWRPEPIPDLTGPLTRLRVVGALWTGAELVTLSRSATCLRNVRGR